MPGGKEWAALGLDTLYGSHTARCTRVFAALGKTFLGKVVFANPSVKSAALMKRGISKGQLCSILAGSYPEWVGNRYVECIGSQADR